MRIAVLCLFASMLMGCVNLHDKFHNDAGAEIDCHHVGIGFDTFRADIEHRNCVDKALRQGYKASGAS